MLITLANQSSEILSHLNHKILNIGENHFSQDNLKEMILLRIQEMMKLSMLIIELTRFAILFQFFNKTKTN
jgi:hypothetical protein